MRTKFENIVSCGHIGHPENPIDKNELLTLAANERVTPSINDKERILLLCIDIQQDFMENGSLAVPGSHGDVTRLVTWMYRNLEKISRIVTSIDTHTTYQIFHPCWWIDENGNSPPPFTPITSSDIDNGKWRAVKNPVESVEYIKNLETLGKKTLMVWPYHCLVGTTGQALENQFANAVLFHSVARKSVPQPMIKGGNPMSEMYGILKAEYDPKNRVNIKFLNDVSEYDKVIIAGEAKSHCVLESIKQILDHYAAQINVTRKIYILEDCMSNIPGFEAQTDTEFNRFKKDFKVNIVQSDKFDL